MQDNSQTALITGASSGIGREMARVFSAAGYRVVLVARRAEALQSLADELPNASHCLPCDLTRTRACGQLVNELQHLDIDIDVLVNNAGMAHSGAFADMSGGNLTALLDLNVRALADLTLRLLPGMLERRRGHVINVASIVGFQAVPGMTLYAASKAFVLSFSEGLAEELRGSGVGVTALCPGLTQTDMVDSLQAANVPTAAMSSAADVAREALQAMQRNETIRIPGYLNQALVGWLSTQPRWLVRTVSGFAARLNLNQPD